MEAASKICPDCGEDDIRIAARICKHCRYEFPSEPEVTESDDGGEEDEAADPTEEASPEKRRPFAAFLPFGVDADDDAIEEAIWDAHLAGLPILEISDGVKKYGSRKHFGSDPTLVSRFLQQRRSERGLGSVALTIDEPGAMPDRSGPWTDSSWILLATLFMPLYLFFFARKINRFGRSLREDGDDLRPVPVLHLFLGLAGLFIFVPIIASIFALARFVRILQDRADVPRNQQLELRDLLPVLAVYVVAEVGYWIYSDDVGWLLTAAVYALVNGYAAHVLDGAINKVDPSKVAKKKSVSPAR